MPPDATGGDYEFGELPHVIVHVAGSEGSYPPLLAISSFLYDLNLVYEVVRLATDRDYDECAFSPATFYANGRPLKAPDRLRVVHLGVGSPFDLVTAVLAVPAAAGAIFALTKALGQMARIPLDWQKTRAEIAKLKAQTRHIEAMTSKVSYQVTALDEARRGHSSTAADREPRSLPPYASDMSLQRRLTRRDALWAFTRAEHRLSRSELVVDRVDIQHVDVFEGDVSESHPRQV